MTNPRYSPPVQLELSLFGERSLRAAITHYLARHAEHISDATLLDYRDRGVWCMREFGAETDIASIDYDAMDRVVLRCRVAIREVTLKKRLTFLRAVLKFAKKRRLLVEVPDLPRLKDDGERKTAIHTVEQWQIVRELLPAGPFRRFYDLGFWTGHHTHDIFTMERWMLDPERPITDEAGKVVGRGMFLRRNHKNKRATPVWMNMQPELRLIVPALLEDVRPNETGLVIGRLWNVRRTLHMACDRAAAAGHADIPRISPIDLRRSFASMLSGRGHAHEYIRIALGHEGPDSHIQGGVSKRPTTATRHYLQVTPALISAAVSRE